MITLQHLQKAKKIHISAMWICPERTKNQFLEFWYFSVKAEYPEAAYTYESVLNCLTAIEWVQISDALRLWKVYLLKLWRPQLRVPKNPLFAFIMLNHIICLKNQVKGCLLKQIHKRYTRNYDDLTCISYNYHYYFWNCGIQNWPNLYKFRQF